jgi:hypothetical protein
MARDRYSATGGLFGKIGTERPTGLALNPREEWADGKTEATKGHLGGNHPGELPFLRGCRVDVS